MSKENKNPNVPGQDDNLTEEILKQRGKSQEEIDKMGQLDRGEDLFESTLDEKFRTTGSPVHKAIWNGKTPLALFGKQPLPAGVAENPDYKAKMAKCVEIVARHREAGTLYGADAKVTQAVIDDLAAVGYWGALIDPKFGGWGAKLIHFMPFLTELAANGDPTVAGMASIHGCIGAVDPLEAFGTDELKAHYLPLLASGKKLSAFALTEPGAGSDLTALKSTAVLDGNDYVVNGRKMFISNILPGRTVGLVVKIKGKDLPGAADLLKAHAESVAAGNTKLADKITAELERPRPCVLIADLPETENDQFKLDRYGIHAVTHIHNYGIVFSNFRVPAKNLLTPPVGDGLIIAYHGLNRGRVALCANAAGTMRVILKSMLPWADFRETYGDKILHRELVKQRVARSASLIVGADALVEWCSSLLDEGYRGELECIVAKIFGSNALTETAIDLGLLTHGGRSFLKGHLIGDNLHDFIAPRIYEGENNMLAMAEFKGLVKAHGMKYMGPMMGFNPAKPGTWKLKYIPAMIKMGLWTAWSLINRDGQSVSTVHPSLRKHAKFALKRFRKLMRKIHFAMLQYQVKLADRQLRMIELSNDVQRTVTMLATVMHATRKGDEATLLAADILCRDLTREIAGGRKDDAYFIACSKLAKLVSDGKFAQLDGVADSAILYTYPKN